MSKTRPLISVALCSFNGVQYLSEQLESIIHQTYQNLEIIIVDDCSTDETWDLISDYAKKDPRIKPYQNLVNRGFNKNFEKAISLTTGDFIGLSDQDDIWDKNKIAELYDSIDDNWVVFSNSHFIDDQGQLLNSSLLPNFRLNNLDYNSLLLSNYVTGHTSLINRECLKYIFPVPVEGFYDWWMGFVAMYHHKLVYVDKALTKYRVHVGSVIQQIGKQEKTFKRNKKSNLVLQLESFLQYRNLKVEDEEAIYRVLNVVKKGLNDHLWSFVKLMVFQYSLYFPHKKKRGVLSRINFARRFLKGL